MTEANSSYSVLVALRGLTSYSLERWNCFALLKIVKKRGEGRGQQKA